MADKGNLPSTVNKGHQPAQGNRGFQPGSVQSGYKAPTQSAPANPPSGGSSGQDSGGKP
jgi:hypothetical protein